MKLRCIILHILMCLALAFIVPSCVDSVEDPEEIVDGEEDEDGEYDGDVLYEEALENICDFVNDLYLESSTLKELASHSKSIKKIKGVAKVYTSDVALFVETVHGAKLSWTYFPVPEVKSSDDYQVTLITAEGLETKSEASLYEIVPEYENVCIIFQMCDDERYEDLLSEYEELADRLEDCGAYVDMVYDFDIEFLQESITEYDVVILVTSGFYEKDINGEYKHWIMLSEDGEDYLYETGEDVSSDVICGFVKEYWNGEDDYYGYLMVSEDFLEENIGGSFDETSLIFNTAGESLNTDSGLSDMFESKGAGAYVGYENAGMDIASEKTFFEGLMQGGSVSEALAVMDVLTSSISKGDDVRIVDKDSDDDMDDGDDDGNGNEDEEQILDPEEAAKYVSESAYKVAEYIKKNYSDSYSVEDFEAIIDWLNTRKYVMNVEWDEYYRDIYSTFTDGTDFHIVTVLEPEYDDEDPSFLPEMKSSSSEYGEVYNVETISNEVIQDNNNFLYIEGSPIDRNLHSDRVSEIDSPLSIKYEVVQGLNFVNHSDLTNYGAILIGKTHGAGKGLFLLSTEYHSGWGWDFHMLGNAILRVQGLGEYPLVSRTVSLEELYSQPLHNPFVYANYCWSAEFSSTTKVNGSFVGYINRSGRASSANIKRSFQYFKLLFNGYTHFDAYSMLDTDIIEDTFLGTVIKSYGEDYLRYFSIQTDEPEITNDNRVIVKGQFKGYKNLKPEVTYKIYYKEGHWGFSSPNESGVESITLNKDDIGSDGTLRVDITDKLKIYKYYSLCLGFEYNGNCYIGKIYSDFRTPLTVTPGKWVDLGLSVEWAGWNVDANSPEEYGGYYAWGETETKDNNDYIFDEYKHIEHGGCYICEGENCESRVYKFIGEEISGTSDDVAHIKWGGGARMPTRNEAIELVQNCTFKKGSYNGVKGVYVLGPNGKCIFIPFAGVMYDGKFGHEGYSGDCWTGTCTFYYPSTICEDCSCAYALEVSAGLFDCSDYGSYRYYGKSVRPVRDK